MSTLAYLTAGFALALVGGSFPLIGLSTTRPYAYWTLGVVCGLLVVCCGTLLLMGWRRTPSEDTE